MQAFIVCLVCLSRNRTHTCFQKLAPGKTKASFSVNIFSWSLRWVMCDSSPVFESVKILKKGIKVTLVSVPVLPSPSPPSTVYRRPLSIMLFGGRGGDLSITILTAAHVWLPTRSWFIEGAACCLYNGSTNLDLFWSFENHRWRVMQSFLWLCLIRSRMASWHINNKNWVPPHGVGIILFAFATWVERLKAVKLGKNRNYAWGYL